MTKDEQYMLIALEEARKASANGEVPVGCVIVSDDCIVGKGYNQTETLRDVTAHAEIVAITAAEQTLASKYLRGCTLYVTVEPCTMCAGAIGWAQVGRLVYGTSDSKRGFTLLAPDVLHPKCEVNKGILEDDCKQLMQEFFQEKRK